MVEGIIKIMGLVIHTGSGIKEEKRNRKHTWFGIVKKRDSKHTWFGIVKKMTPNDVLCVSPLDKITQDIKKGRRTSYVICAYMHMIFPGRPVFTCLVGQDLPCNT